VCMCACVLCGALLVIDIVRVPTTLQRTIDTVLVHASHIWDSITTPVDDANLWALLPEMHLMTSTHRNYFPRVISMYESLGIPLLQPSPRERFLAGELVFPCNIPRMHPYLWRKLRHILRVPELVPRAQRKNVIYLSRAPGVGRLFHQDRFVVNEMEVRQSITRAIAQFKSLDLVYACCALSAGPPVYDIASSSSSSSSSV
jgi:hypothetical protein